MSQPLILVAGGGLAREVLTVCEALGQPVLGIVDDFLPAAQLVGGVPVLGGLDAVHAHPEVGLVLCAGKGQIRREMGQRLAAQGVAVERYRSVIDPSVRVPSTCSIGVGTILLCGVVLTTDVHLGAHVACMPQVTLHHDNRLADYATLCAGVRLGGCVEIGEAAYLGINSSVRQGCRVGAGALLGMGGVLVTDQPDNSIWAGVPARQLKERE